MRALIVCALPTALHAVACEGGTCAAAKKKDQVLLQSAVARHSSNESSTAPLPDSASGFKKLDGDCNGMNMGGSTRLNAGSDVDNLNQCADLCRRNPQCKGFSIPDGGANSCYLKSGICNDPRKGRYAFYAKAKQSSSRSDARRDPPRRRSPPPQPSRKSDARGADLSARGSGFKKLSGDCGGNDLANKKLEGNDQQRTKQCADECAKLNACKGFSIPERGINDCYLKTKSCSNPKSGTGWIFVERLGDMQVSGYERLSGDCEGGNIGDPVKLEGVADDSLKLMHCSNACNNNRACQGFSVPAAGDIKDCYLKAKSCTNPKTPAEESGWVFFKKGGSPTPSPPPPPRRRAPVPAPPRRRVPVPAPTPRPATKQYEYEYEYYDVTTTTRAAEKDAEEDNGGNYYYIYYEDLEDKQRKQDTRRGQRGAKQDRRPGQARKGKKVRVKKGSRAGVLRKL